MYEGTKHAFASDALNRNVPKDKLQKFLGDTDARSTDRYAKLADGAAGLSLAEQRSEKAQHRRTFWRGGRDSNRSRARCRSIAFPEPFIHPKTG